MSQNRRPIIPDNLKWRENGEAYVSEAQRLGVTPQSYDERDDRRNSPAKQTQMPGPKRKLIQGGPPALVKAAPNQPLPRRGLNVPAPTYVQVGVHEEQKWFDDDLISGPPRSKETKIVDNNEDVDVESLQTMSDQSNSYRRVTEVLEQDSNAAQATDENAWVHSDEKVSEADEVVPGEYALFINGELISKSTDISKIRQAAEELILSQQVDLSDVALFKRLTLDFGLIINDGKDKF